MSLFIGVLDELSKRIDNCVALPNASIRRVQAEIRKLDREQGTRIKKQIRR
jgi:hypothetical protein